MARELRVLQCGLGPIGLGIARRVLEVPGLKLVGAVDLSPEVAGRDLGLVLDLGRRLRLKVEADLARLLRKLRGDVAIVSTSSSLRRVKGDLASLIQKGWNVVSTCEELAFPTPRHQAAVRELDRLARKKKVAVLATGVNPGFAMDALALVLTAPCTRVERVAVTRVVDAATRRLPLQRKVGAGLSISQFRRALSDRMVRHVGLVESLYMIAAGLGWKLDRVEETLEPAIAPRDLETEHLRVPAGAVAGIKQFARAFRGGELVISLDLQMYVGAEMPRDHVLIAGEPPIDMTIAGGVAGDAATTALVINSVPKLLASGPGALTMRDLPLVHHVNPVELRALSRAV
jgi:4-hydroxy-tetrahydrodipicolinate reductase